MWWDHYPGLELSQRVAGRAGEARAGSGTRQRQGKAAYRVFPTTSSRSRKPIVQDEIGASIHPDLAVQ